jgi:hypothetical protein
MAPGESEGGFPDPFKKLEDFSLAGVRIDQNPPTVPEPATLALLGFGLSGIAAARRRRAQLA